MWQRGRPVRPAREPDGKHHDRRQDPEHHERVAQEADVDLRSLLDGCAEKAGCRGCDRVRGGDLHAVRPPLLVDPGDRLGPLAFERGSGRPAVRPRNLLPPVAVVSEPGEPVVRAACCWRQQHDLGLLVAGRPARVVTPETGLRTVSQVHRLDELVGVRTRARVDDRVFATPFELLFVPGRALGALVLRVADELRRPAQRLLRRRRVEDELDHLPVTLVLVVPVVERVVEPVLECELAPFLGDVRVRRRRLPAATRLNHSS